MLEKEIREEMIALQHAKGDKKAINEDLDEVKARISEHEKNLIALLEGSGMIRAHFPDGSVSVSEVTSVKVPKEPGDRAEFFGHLKQQGIFDDMITVHSATINAWYKAELENQGKDLVVPGLNQITKYKKINLAKGI